MLVARESHDQSGDDDGNNEDGNDIEYGNFCCPTLYACCPWVSKGYHQNDKSGGDDDDKEEEGVNDSDVWWYEYGKKNYLIVRECYLFDLNIFEKNYLIVRECHLFHLNIF